MVVSCLVPIYVVIVQRRFMQFLVMVERTILSKRMYHVKLIGWIMFILSFFALTLPRKFSLTTKRNILEVYTPIGISYHQNKSKILMPKGLAYYFIWLCMFAINVCNHFPMVMCWVCAARRLGRQLHIGISSLKEDNEAPQGMRPDESGQILNLEGHSCHHIL